MVHELKDERKRESDQSTTQRDAVIGLGMPSWVTPRDKRLVRKPSRDLLKRGVVDDDLNCRECQPDSELDIVTSGDRDTVCPICAQIGVDLTDRLSASLGRN